MCSDKARRHLGCQPRGQPGCGQRERDGEAAHHRPQHLQPEGTGARHGHGRRHQGQQGRRRPHSNKVI